jgi:hypothetical protein
VAEVAAISATVMSSTGPSTETTSSLVIVILSSFRRGVGSCGRTARERGRQPRVPDPGHQPAVCNGFSCRPPRSRES